MSALARIKRAVRAAIAANGGIDGAAHSIGKGRSWVGDWNNRNSDALPNLADAHELDEVALIESGTAPILAAYARELGHVAIRLPDVETDESALVMQLAEATGEFGDVAHSITRALANGQVDPGERDEIARQIDEAQEALARLRLIALASKPVAVPVNGKGAG